MTDPRVQRGVLVTAIVVALVVVTVTVAHARSRQSSDTIVAPGSSGVYTGGRDAPGVAAFEAWRHRPAAVVPQFPTWADWSQVEIDPTWTGYWSSHPHAYRLAVRVAPMPDGSGITLAQVATGQYDSHFAAAGRNLVAAGLGNSIIRIGHEFNGGWYPWAAQSNPSAYAATFRHVETAMKSVPGQSFVFDWNVSGGSHTWDATLAYPGDSYVDEVGVDLYDKWYGHAVSASARWSHSVNPTDGSKQGLQFWQNFADTHGKPLAFPEWGLYATKDGNGGGGGDDPLYVTNMHSWVVNHNVAWESYFNKDASDGTHKLSHYPNAQAKYLALFGG